MAHHREFDAAAAHGQRLLSTAARWLCAVIICLCNCGCAHTGERRARTANDGAGVTVRLHLAFDAARPNHRQVEDENGVTLYLAPDPALTEQDIVEARSMHGQHGHAVQIVFSGVGAAKLRDVTIANSGQRLAFLIDEDLLTAPRIFEPIAGGTAVISGGFSREQAVALAARITRAASVSPPE